MTRSGHLVLVQKGAGAGSGLSDEEYIAKGGARVVDTPEEIWGAADLVMKVKEPQPERCCLLRPGLMVLTYFHFPASERLTKAVVESGATAIAYETIHGAKGGLPCLTPMSEVAGRMSIQQGAKYLERPQEGRGIL